MSQEFASISDHIEVIKRRRIPFAAVLISVLLAATLLAFKLPATFESTSTIYVDDQTIPEEFVQSTVNTYVDEQIQIISAHVLTRANIESMIDEFQLIDEADSEILREDAISKFRNSVLIEPVRAGVVDERSQRTGFITIAFTVAFQHSNPEICLKVAGRLTQLFLTANVEKRTEAAAETTEFLEAEAKKLNTDIVALEWRMSKFKEENRDSLPELNDLNFQQLDRAQRDLEQTERDIRAIQGRQAVLQAELSGVPPYAFALGDYGEVVNPADRLAQLQRELLTASSKYSDDHPDVTRLKREIASLSGNSSSSASIRALTADLGAKKAQLIEAEQRYSADHPDVINLKANIRTLESQIAQASSNADTGSDRRPPDNPQYLQIRAQINLANQELTALYSRRDSLRRDIATYQDRLIKTPETERLWLNLTRDYEVSVAKYREMRAQIDEAFRSQSLESSEKAERFLLLEPAQLPTSPISPNRPLIFFLGLVSAVVLSVGLVIFLETIDTTVRNSKDIVSILGAPPLTTIPVIHNRSDIAAATRQKVLYTSLFAGLIAVGFFVLI